MKAAIIDDEAKSRSILATMLNRYCPEVAVIGEAHNMEEGLRLIQYGEPELIFLDISMPGGSGFELLERIEERSLHIIFITAYDGYAIQAIRKDALDYLLKPVNIGELKAAVNKALERQNKEKTPNEFQHIREAMKQETLTKKVAIPNRNGLLFIDLKDIIRLEADGSYTRFHLSSGKSVLSSRLLKEYDTNLPSHLFFRVHHSHIINLDHILFYERGDGGNIVMSDNSSIALSKRKKKGFLERFRVNI